MSTPLSGSSISGIALSYQTGAVAPDGAVLVIATENAKEDLLIPHGHLLIFRDGAWQHAASVEYFCKRVCWRQEPTPEWLVLGQTGAIARVSPAGDMREERLYPPPAKPLAMGTMHGMCVVGAVAYAVGMRRQAFSDHGRGNWSSIADDMPTWSRPAAVVGFEAVDSFPDQNVYAVGWAGEIATRVEGRWRRIDSPVNRILTSVVCAGDGSVYACGQRGAILRGYLDTWEVIAPGIPPEDLWSVVWYDGAVHAASLRSVFRLADGCLRRLDIGEALTCYHLSTAANFLCSVGARSITLFDGATWRLITPW